MLNDDSTNNILDMFEELLGSTSKEKKSKQKKAVPYQVFIFPEEVGTETWVLDTVNKKMIRAFNKSEIVQISKPDEDDKVLVRYAGTFVRVPLEYVCDIGFN
jgi:hypothetical protein|tara:strand:+ start:867 stop:1172 length:306 start_codon:yes stop_codon:yes gene_type:complete